jgi:hypothetical protein
VAYSAAQGFARSEVVDRLQRIVAFAGARGLLGAEAAVVHAAFHEDRGRVGESSDGRDSFAEGFERCNNASRGGLSVSLPEAQRREQIHFLMAWADKHVATIPVVSSRKDRKTVAGFTARKAARDAAQWSTHLLSPHSITHRFTSSYCYMGSSHSMGLAETELMGGMRTSCCEPETLQPTMWDAASVRSAEGAHAQFE